MRTIPFLFALLALAVGSSCTPSGRDPDRLSMDDRTAYLIILDQLNQLSDRAEIPVKHFNLCVGASSSTDSTFQIDDQFLEDLRAEMPPDLSVTLVHESECVEQNGVDPYAFPDGTSAWHLFAYRRPRIMEDGDRWSGGVSCGSLCGWGNSYRVDFRLGRQFVTRTGILFS